jgi:hypothetical protein
MTNVKRLTILLAADATARGNARAVDDAHARLKQRLEAFTTA